MTVEDMRTLAESLGRKLVRRTTLYATVPNFNRAHSSRLKMAAGFQPRSFVDPPQSGDLRPHEPADEQDASRDQRATERGRQAYQRSLPEYSPPTRSKARAPVIGGLRGPN